MSRLAEVGADESFRSASRTRNSGVFPIVGAVDATTDRTTR